MTYRERANLTDAQEEVIQNLARDAGCDPDDDTNFDLGNYVLRSGPWDAEDDPTRAAIEWAADPSSEHCVLATLALRQAWGVPIL